MKDIPPFKEKMSKAEIEKRLQENGQAIMRRIAVLQRVAKQGCDDLQEAAQRFEATKNRFLQKGGAAALLNEPELMGLVSMYDLAQGNENRVSLMQMVLERYTLEFKRDLLKARDDLAKILKKKK